MKSWAKIEREEARQQWLIWRGCGAKRDKTRKGRYRAPHGAEKVGNARLFGGVGA